MGDGEVVVEGGEIRVFGKNGGDVMGIGNGGNIKNEEYGEGNEERSGID